MKKSDAVRQPQQHLKQLTSISCLQCEGVQLTVESLSALRVLFLRGMRQPVRISALITHLHEQLKELDSLSAVPDYQVVHNSSLICHWRIEDAIESLIKYSHLGKREFSAESLSQLFDQKGSQTNDNKLH